MIIFYNQTQRCIITQTGFKFLFFNKDEIKNNDIDFLRFSFFVEQMSIEIFLFLLNLIFKQEKKLFFFLKNIKQTKLKYVNIVYEF